MRSFSRVLGVAALAMSMSQASLAFGGDTSTAELAFQQGLDAMKRNQFKEACDAFAGSNEADPSPGTQINLALCNEKQGKLATAWGWYRTAAGTADQHSQRERAELARGEAAKLEPKLHKLTIVVKVPADGLTVTRNGASIPSAVLGSDVPIDPGDYALEVNAKGKKPWTKSIHIAAGPGIDRVEVPALEDAPVDARPAGAAPGADYQPPRGGGNDGATQRTVGFVLGGAGILALVAAGGIQIFNLAVTNQDYKNVEKQNADAKCGDGAGHLTNPDCPQLEKSLQSKDDARHANQTASLVVGIGGAALLVTGIVLLVTAPSSRSASISRPLVLPLVGRDLTGVGLSGSF